MLYFHFLNFWTVCEYICFFTHHVMLFMTLHYYWLHLPHFVIFRNNFIMGIISIAYFTFCKSWKWFEKIVCVKMQTRKQTIVSWIIDAVINLVMYSYRGNWMVTWENLGKSGMLPESTSSLRWVKSTCCNHSHCITLKKWVQWYVYS